MDFETLLTQFKTIKKMGSLRSIMKLLPGMSAIPKEVLDGANDGQMNRMEALILSMTPDERRNPDILSGSRKRRIAAGSGSSVEEVNRLVKALDEMQRQMKQFSKMARFQKSLKSKKARRR